MALEPQAGQMLYSFSLRWAMLHHKFSCWMTHVIIVLHNLGANIALIGIKDDAQSIGIAWKSH